MKLIKIVVSVTLATIILSLVLIPIINSFEPDSVSRGWVYDDYVSANGVTDVEGALELVTVDGVSYVHAKDVGAGKIQYSNGKIQEISVDKAPLDLVYMYGQSNAAYRNAVPSEVSPVPKLGTAYYFGLEDRSGPTASENNTGMDLSQCDFWTMLDENGDCRIGDKAPSFSATYNQITGHKVYWVCGAIGNKGIGQFQPPTGFMWTYGKSVLQDAIALVDTDKFDLNITYYIWCQGEANATSPVEQYKSMFLNMHNALIHGEMGYKFKGCFISVVRDQNGTNSAIAQRELCEEYDTIHLGADIAKDFTVENGLMGSDDLHYSQLGNNLIGKTVGENMGNYVERNLNPISPMTYSILVLIPVFVAISIVLYVCNTLGILDSIKGKFDY